MAGKACPLISPEILKERIALCACRAIKIEAADPPERIDVLLEPRDGSRRLLRAGASPIKIKRGEADV
jgi:hypothetical protein